MFSLKISWVYLLLAVGVSAQHLESREYLPHHFLRQLNLDETREEGTRLLMGYLNSEVFSDRQFAQRELLDMKIVPIDQLEAAATSTDPEVRNFGRRLKKHVLINLEDPIIRAFGEIRKERMTGWTLQILQALPYCHTVDMFYQAELALSTTISDSDLALFKEGLNSDKPQVRRMSVLCLHRMMGAEALPELTPALTDKDDGVRLAAAQVLDMCLDIRCLDLMVGLLTSLDRDIRGDAITFLRQLALKSFGYFINASAEENREAIGSWGAWAQTEGRGTLAAVYKDPDAPRLDPDLLADFTFAADVLNRVDTKRATVRNLPFKDQALYFNGLFGYEDSEDDSYYFGWNLPEWNGKALTITLEFKPETFAANRMRTPYTFFLFGQPTPWFEARRNHNGKLELTFDNQKQIVVLDPSIEAGHWHKLSVSLDLQRYVILVRLDDEATQRVQLQPPVLPKRSAGDDVLTFTNYGNTSVFRGWVHGLKVYGRTLSAEELADEHASGRFLRDE